MTAPALRPRTWSQKLIAILALSILAMLGSLSTAQSASAATASVTKASRAYGYTFGYTPHYHGGGWAGTYRVPNPANTSDVPRGFCVDPNQYMARATSFIRTTGAIPNMPTANYYRARGIQNEYGMTTNSTLARRGFWTVRLLQNYSYYIVDVNYLKAHGGLTTSEYNAIVAMYKQSAYYGDVAVTVKATATTYNESGSGTAVFKSHGAYLKAGYPVTISLKGGVVTSVNGVKSTASGTVRSYGKVTYTFRQTGTADVVHYASVTVPSHKVVTITKRPSTAYQRLMLRSEKLKYTGSYTVHKIPGKGSVTSACSLNCDGTATVTVTVCNYDASSPAKFPVRNASGAVITYVSAAAKACGSGSFTGHDADVIVVKDMCFTATVGGVCTTGYVAIPVVTYTIVCPAWEQAEIRVGCNCDTNWASVVFTTPASPRYYTGAVLFTNGTSTITMPVNNLVKGQSTTVVLPFKVQAGTIIEAQFSVFKDAAHTQPIIANKTIVKIQVLSVSGTGAAAKATVDVLKDTTAGSVKAAVVQ